MPLSKYRRDGAGKPILAAAIVAALAVGLGAWLFLQETARQEEHARGATTLGHLTAFEVYFQEYHQKYGHLPPAYLTDVNGVPMHSWRVLLLEFIDPSLYAAYDFREPWNGPNNRRLADRMPSFYATQHSRDSNTVFTNYVVITGQGTPFPGTKSRSFRDIPNPSQTILIAEIAKSNIHWMEPRDLSIGEISFTVNDFARPSISTDRTTGPGVLYANGSKRLLDPTISPEALKAMLFIEAKEVPPQNP